MGWKKDGLVCYCVDEPTAPSRRQANRIHLDTLATNNPPEAASTPSPSEVVTKSFTLTREDVAAIEAVRRDEGLLSDSAALRWLIRKGNSARTNI